MRSTPDSIGFNSEKSEVDKDGRWGIPSAASVHPVGIDSLMALPLIFTYFRQAFSLQEPREMMTRRARRTFFIPVKLEVFTVIVTQY